MKQIFLIITMITLSVLRITAQVPTQQSKQKSSEMNRKVRAEKKYQELFGAQIVASKTDPELMNILQRFIFGEVYMGFPRVSNAISVIREAKTD